MFYLSEFNSVVLGVYPDGFFFCLVGVVQSKEASEYNVFKNTGSNELRGFWHLKETS